MSAGVFAAFTVEAFLNHLGQRHVRDWESLERKLGPREKLIILRQVLHLSIDEGKRPYQTFYNMLQLRNSLAHGKTLETNSKVIVANSEDESANNPEPTWKRLCTLSSVTRMVEDAEAIVRDLSTQTGHKGDPLVSPMSGRSGFSEVGNQ